MLLLVRFPLRLVVTALVLLFLGVRFLLRPRLVRYGLLVLVVGGAIAWNTLGAQLLPQLQGKQADQQTVSVAVTAELPQPAAVEQYLKAQTQYDAATMWGTMSDRYRRRMEASNNSMEQLQAQLDSSRAREQRYSGATYVGGANLDKGGGVYLYILTVTSPTASAQLPFTFTLDQDGKIANIQ